jgi:hypothetical protein
MNESKNVDTISNRVKQRREEKERPGRVGGDAHRKLVLRRKKEYDLKKRRAGKKFQC